MPRVVPRKSFKSVCVDTVLFFAMFALVGHLSINFWEKYTIQSELTIMKQSLNSLKDTITNIGKAYDNLYSELRELFIMVDQSHQCLEQKKPDARCKSIYNLSHPKGLQDLEVQTLLTPGNQTKAAVGIATNCSKQIETDSYEHKATGPLGKNVTTNTITPVDTGTTPDNQSPIDQITQIIPTQNRHTCYKDLEHCRQACRQSKLEFYKCNQSSVMNPITQLG
ncbi:hypothetical protein B5X24_HaOG209272 [Helicoverpa armigera]|nr:hypothetical protein B5X24_HaOG209272 [Helicoverpa armigera]